MILDEFETFDDNHFRRRQTKTKIFAFILPKLLNNRYLNSNFGDLYFFQKFGTSSSSKTLICQMAFVVQAPPLWNPGEASSYSSISFEKVRDEIQIRLSQVQYERFTWFTQPALLRLPPLAKSTFTKFKMNRRKKSPRCYKCSTLDRRVSSTASWGLLAQHLLDQLFGHQHAVLALSGHPLWCHSWTSVSKFIQGTQWIQSAQCLRCDLVITTEFGKRL